MFPGLHEDPSGIKQLALDLQRNPVIARGHAVERRRSLAAFVVVVGIVMSYRQGLPDPSELETITLSQESVVLDRNGVELARFSEGERREVAEFGDIPPILIDATIVRAVLRPASMKLLGERNWYLPSWLEWLPRLSWEGEVAADDAAQPERAPRRTRVAERGSIRIAGARRPRGCGTPSAHKLRQTKGGRRQPRHLPPFSSLLTRYAHHSGGT